MRGRKKAKGREAAGSRAVMRGWNECAVVSR